METDRLTTTNDERIYGEEPYSDNGILHQEDGVYINHWTPSISKKIREYAIKASGLSWETDHDASHYNGLNSSINANIALISAVNSVGLTGIIALFEYKESLAVRILFYMLTCIAILLNVSICCLQNYQSSKDLHGKIITGSINSFKHGKLTRKLFDEMVLDPHERKDAITLLDYTSSRFNELDREKPFIRSSTSDKWVKNVDIMKENGTFNTVFPYPYELSAIHMDSKSMPLSGCNDVRCINEIRDYISCGV